MPYDHKNTTPDGLSSQRMKLMLKKTNYFHCQNRCMVGSGGGGLCWYIQIGIWHMGQLQITCSTLQEFPWPSLLRELSMIGLLHFSQCWCTPNG